MSFTHFASRVRHSPALHRYDSWFRRLEPAWNRVMESSKKGYLAHVNGDPLRLSYTYGARYEKLGYEPAVHREFTSRIQPGEIVLDIGAHVGFFTLAAALRGARVFAFEPAPETAGILTKHIQMNGFQERVELLRAVMTEHVGETAFYVHGDTMSAAIFRENIERLSPQIFVGPPVALTLPATTIDAFCNARQIVPQRIKLDIEGAEAAVLRGATEILRTGAEILVEVHPDGLPYAGGTVQEVEHLLTRNGRSIKQVSTPNVMGIYHLLSVR